MKWNLFENYNESDIMLNLSTPIRRILMERDHHTTTADQIFLGFGHSEHNSDTKIIITL